MNILQILPELKSGGVETGTVDLSKELTRRGHKTVVISNGGELAEELTNHGIVHYTLPVHKKSLFTVLRMINKIRDIIVYEKIDIVHARSRVPAIAAFLASLKTKVPFITTCHGYYSTHLFSRIMALGKFVIVASNIIARHMAKDFGVPYDRIRLIPRGVDLEKFPYKVPKKDVYNGSFIIGIIGRITPIKGHTNLIKAMSKIARSIPNVQLRIIGDAPAEKPKYKQELETLVKRLSLSKYVHFLGQRQDIPEQLKEIDLLVMPSIGEEAFGRAIIEAQAAGVPVIATKIGGIVDIITHNENGLLIPPDNYNSIAEVVIKLIKDDDLRMRLSKGGRLSVEKNFSLANMYEKTLNVYNETLSSFKILIIKWSALGDIILSLPAMKAVRKKFPNAYIIVLTSVAGRQILDRYNYADEYIIYENKKWLNGYKELLSVSKAARDLRIDLVLDLQNNRKSHLTAFMSLARRRIGYKSGKMDFLLNEGISGAKERLSPIQHQFKLLKALEIEEEEKTALRLLPNDKDNKEIELLLKEAWIGQNQPLIGINFASSIRWHTKRWPLEFYAKLCDLLAQKGIRVIITGAINEREQAKELISLTCSKPINAAGKTTIMQLAALIKKCKVFVTGDSAPMHIAAAVGIPFVALFGPTDPKRHLESYERYELIYKNLDCSPCYRSKCPSRKCIKNITPEEVVNAVISLLKIN